MAAIAMVAISSSDSNHTNGNTIYHNNDDINTTILPSIGGIIYLIGGRTADIPLKTWDAFDVKQGT